MNVLSLFLLIVKGSDKMNFRKELLKRHIAHLERICFEKNLIRFFMPEKAMGVTYDENGTTFEYDFTRAKIDHSIKIPPMVVFIMRHIKEISMGKKFSMEEYEKEVKEMKDLQIRFELEVPEVLISFLTDVEDTLCLFNEFVEELQKKKAK
ncbi:uncharacterized protein VNE69_11125 [Vairimorpha necatrix]|uniref:Uncharacterized protein n=1 Tax=Vairimorpha necatrix TaxID=6039 RepID=A0AAX4JG76_9MICR